MGPVHLAEPFIVLLTRLWVRGTGISRDAVGVRTSFPTVPPRIASNGVRGGP